LNSYDKIHETHSHIWTDCLRVLCRPFCIRRAVTLFWWLSIYTKFFINWSIINNSTNKRNKRKS
jgi:hypothetical protein